MLIGRRAGHVAIIVALGLSLQDCGYDDQTGSAATAAKAALLAKLGKGRRLAFEDVRAFQAPSQGPDRTFAFCGQVSVDGAEPASFVSRASSVSLEDVDPADYARMAETYCVGEPHPVRF